MTESANRKEALCLLRYLLTKTASFQDAMANLPADDDLLFSIRDGAFEPEWQWAGITCEAYVRFGIEAIENNWDSETFCGHLESEIQKTKKEI